MVEIKPENSFGFTSMTSARDLIRCRRHSNSWAGPSAGTSQMELVRKHRL